MNETSLSLLDEVIRQPSGDAWQQLVEIYTPLLRSWLARYGVADSDRDDLIQEVLLVLLRELPQFRHNRHPGAFRSWLRAILVHRLRHYWRSRSTKAMASGDSRIAEQLEQLEDPASGLSRLWNQQHDAHVAQQLLRRAEPQFSTTTWTAFRRVVLEGAEVCTVAAELNVTPNTIYIAKSRVLATLRKLAAGLVDGSMEEGQRGGKPA